MDADVAAAEANTNMLEIQIKTPHDRQLSEAKNIIICVAFYVFARREA